MHTESRDIVAPGESASNIHSYYYQGIHYLMNMNHYGLVEPDVAVIRYIDDGYIYTLNYDFKSDCYTKENNAIAAYQWTKNKVGDYIPKPDVPVLASMLDTEDSFWFEAYGMSSDQFDAYVNACKSQGYTVDVSDYRTYGISAYSAYDKNGYGINLTYDESGHVMAASVEAPEEVIVDQDKDSTASSQSAAGQEQSMIVEPSSEITDAPVVPSKSEPEKEESKQLVNGMRPEFKKAMDSYEEFFDEYIAFTKKYSDSDASDLNLLADYVDYMEKYADTMADMEAWNSKEMNQEELNYYIEVQARISQKLLNAAS